LGAEWLMEIIGKQSQGSYLVLTKDDKDPMKRKARVLDLIQGKLFKEQSLEIILKQGYWQDYSAPKGELKALLKLVKEE